MEHGKVERETDQIELSNSEKAKKTAPPESGDSRKRRENEKGRKKGQVNVEHGTLPRFQREQLEHWDMAGTVSSWRKQQENTFRSFRSALFQAPTLHTGCNREN